METMTRTENITLTINGKQVQAGIGSSILEAARSADIYIPSLCYYRGLRPLPEVVPDMACQLCMVEVNGKIVLSCETKVEEGMKVETETAAVQATRKLNLTELMRRHPNTCISCDRKERCQPLNICLRTPTVNERCLTCVKNTRCELQTAIDYIGLGELPTYISKKLPVREDSPVFIRDHNLCILCERCVRVCDEITQAKAIEFAYPCHRACPAGIDIPRYIRLIARGRPAAALGVIREKVPFPGVLGRVCIHPCESDCQRGAAVDKPLQIKMLKRFAADNGGEAWKELSWKLPETGKSIAVIGAGPAGLTAAFYLAKLGHRVTVFEALPRAGGMMLAGIPEYRLPRDVLDREIGYIKEAGVEIKLDTRITSLDSLFEKGYHAVFVGVGAHQGLKLGVDGEDTPGVMESVEFLRRANLGERLNVGEQVGVVGGGNVAIDAARISLRFGAKKVTMFYRRTRNEMPASPEEVEAALEEGVEILYLAAPSKVTREGNKVKLECIRMQLGEPDASGRARPVPIPDSEFTTELDTLLVAIGQRPDIPADYKVKTDRGNVVKVGADMSASRPGVFAAGDCVNGPASVIEAIAGGRKAAEAIDRYLGGKGDIAESLVAAEEATVWLEKELPAEKMASLSHLPPAESIKSFAEVECGWDGDTARAEAQRCLRCYVITPPGDKVLQDADCQFCGACVDVCPTGALLERSAYQAGAPDRIVTTICPYCGVGCQLKLEIKDERVLRVVPDPDGPANKGLCCVKGKFGMDFITDPNRLTDPLIRKDGRLVKATWDEALDLVAKRLKGYAPDEIAVIASARCTNEDNYITQKFSRVVLGTNNIDHCARLCHAPSVTGLVQTFGSGAMTNSIGEIRGAACIFSIGSNTTATHPVIGLQVKQAVRQGAKLIVANPREIPLAKIADVWLQHKPGSDVALLMGMMRVIVDEGLADSEFVASRCENYEAFAASLKKFDLATVEQITGVPRDKIIKAARIYATARPGTILYAMGITQHSHGTDNVIATANLAMLTGNIGKPSTGVNPLRGQNNVQGACDMGALPTVYPAYQPVSSPPIREKFQTEWECQLNPNPGLTLTEMFDAAHQGKIKAMYLVGENPVLSDPDSNHVRQALERLEFLVVQDIFLTETAELADVVLPAATFAEKDGTFTNTERRVQRIRKAFEPIGNSKPDWWITCQLAQRMGAKGFSFSHPYQIMDEIAFLAPSYGGMSYDRLDKMSLQWPCPSPEYTGTPILHVGMFSRGRGRFLPLEYRAPAELPDKEYPLILTTERSLYHYHTGTMTRKASGLNALRPEELVEINPEDAAGTGIKDGDKVKVVSRRGEVLARAKITVASPAGVVSMSFHFAESPTNRLTSPALDPVAKIPELKVCAVRVEKAG